MKKKFLHPFQEGLHGNSAYDPFNLFNFDADPNPGFALEKMDPDPGQVLPIFLTEEFSN